MATLDASKTQPPKGIKRKRDDDDRVVAMFEALLARNADDTEDDGGPGDESEEDESDEDTQADDESWIDHWVDKPPGERGRKNKEDRPGWGKPEIMTAAGITEDQYHRYMVSFPQLRFFTQYHPEIRTSSVRAILRHDEGLQFQFWHPPGRVCPHHRKGTSDPCKFPLHLLTTGR